MEPIEQELEITYQYDFQEFKERNLHPTTLVSILCCNVIPIVGILLIELILLLICVTLGFTDIRIFYMIIIPSIYCALVLLYTPSFLVLLRIHWKRINRLPLDRKWFFTPKGIIIDKTYTKRLHTWETIQNFVIGRKTIFFGFTTNKIFNFGFDPLSLRFLEEKQFEELLIIVHKYLPNDKIHFKIDREKMKFKDTN
ncbi:MAG: hypothetical protein EAX90_10390 [Candidatus Heimdallarchaeota archaeon]|nr:hypothetical protein [Candidatus Heimdallarchaeota archaeon]